MNYLIIGAICLAIVTMLIYLYTKDSETSRKFFLYEKAIEELNKKIYELEKELQKQNSNNNTDEIKEYIDARFENDMQKITQFALNSQKEIRNSIKELTDEVYIKMNYMDEKLKNFNTIPETYQMNDKKIISLYNKGLSVSEIARNLRVGMGEVELVLKIAGIK
jgi:gas vesicle protein